MPAQSNQQSLAKYHSRGRSWMRMFAQRVLFKAVVKSTVDQQIIVHDAVRTVSGPFVLVANHTSHLDAPMLAQGLPRKQAQYLSTGVAGDYFFKFWYRRWFVRLMFNAFPIDRDGSRTNSGLAGRLLREGIPILVFPEGTRSTKGVMGRFNPGGAALASRVNAPVIPAAIIGGYEAMPKGRNWPKPGRPPVGVVFGAPLYAEPDESVAEFNTRIRNQVLKLYDENKEQILGSETDAESN